MRAPPAPLDGVLSLELFRDAPPAQLAAILARCDVVDYPEGDVVLRAGEPNRQVAFVLAGCLRIRFVDTVGGDFIEAGPGDSVGEMSVIDRSPVSATVVAGPDCRLLLIGEEIFLGEVLALPGVARRLLATLSARVRRGNQQIVERMQAAARLEQLQRELDFARSIQTGMLTRREPLFPDHPEVDCAACMRPAREVGGDLYEAVPIRGRRIFVAVGDVCGKGLPAAMFMMRTLTLLRGELPRRIADPARHAREIAERVNEGLCEHNDANLFVTLFFALLDTDSGLLTYVSAGHNPPLLALPEGRFVELETARDMPAGAMRGVAFNVRQRTLAPGSTLVLYTDGVSECVDAAGRMFDEQRVAQVLDAAPERAGQRLIEHALAAVDAFAAGCEQSDDITLLALNFRGIARRRG